VREFCITNRGIKKRLLTGSNSSSSTSTRRRSASTQGEEVAQPTESELVAITVKVGVECAGSVELADLAGVWRVANGQNGLEPAWGGGDGATVHPDIEAGAATVGTVATLADTTKWQSGDVQSGIVAGDTTGAGGGNNWEDVR